MRSLFSWLAGFGLGKPQTKETFARVLRRMLREEPRVTLSLAGIERSLSRQSDSHNDQNASRALARN